MLRCLICNKFSLLLNEKGVCKNCFNTYSSEAKNIVEVRINYLFSLIDDKIFGLEYRKEKLDELETLYNSFIQTPAGRMLQLYDPKTYDDIGKEIANSKDELNTLLKKKEIVTYSKVNATPDNYVVFDLETTGLDNSTDAILEIGAIKYLGNAETARFHTYVNPMRSIPRAASAINHITAATVRHAPVISTALKNFLSFIENESLIAYNSDFDMGFIQMNCYNIFGTKVENNVIDALPLARKYLPNLPNKKLETVKQHFELNVGSHNAIDDCIVTNHLYQYCKQFEELTYKYIIPFSFNPTDLNDKEVAYLEEIVKICEENGISKKTMSMYKNSSYVSINANGIFVARLKLFSKLQYVLLNVPYQDFCNNINTSIKFSQAGKGQENFTRVFPETPDQLWQLKDYIPTRKIRFQINRGFNCYESKEKDP